MLSTPGIFIAHPYTLNYFVPADHLSSSRHDAQCNIGEGWTAMADEDFTLIRRIALGDQAALSQLYDAYAARLSGFLWHQLATPQEVEEVLQDVFLAVWRSAAGFRAEAPVASWLFRIARQMAANRRRTAGRHARSAHMVPLDEAEMLPDAGASEENYCRSPRATSGTRAAFAPAPRRTGSDLCAGVHPGGGRVHSGHP